MTETRNTYNGKPIEFNPFKGPEIKTSIPSTESQIEIWMSCKFGGNDASRAYNESISLRFKGTFDRVSFEKALYHLVQRHESLRSAFSDDGAHMLVFENIPINIEYHDISDIDASEREFKIKSYNKADVNYIFDLVIGPLFKFGLIKLSESEYFFTITAHHIICDGWSIGLLIQDLSKFYTNFVKGQDADLAPANLFSDYAVEQSRYINSSEYKKTENFWLEQFKSNVPVLNLPTDFPRTNPRSYNSSRIDYVLDNDLALTLKKIGVKEGCSFVNTLLAAFELFLHSYTGQKDIIIGLPTAGQLVSGKYNLVGHCVSLLPIRSYPNTHLNFQEYLKIRKSSILDAYEHQQLSFGGLLKKIKTSRNPSRIPLVPVVFNIDMEIESDTNFYGLEFELYSNPREFENFELFLNIWEANQLIKLEWSYNSHLFKKETIEKMMSNFEELLHAIVSDPSQKLETINQLSRNSISVRSITLTTQLSDKDYWHSKLGIDLPLTELPVDHVRPSVRIYQKATVELTINSSLRERLVLLTDKHKQSIFSGLVGAVYIWLYKYTLQFNHILGISDIDSAIYPLLCSYSNEANYSVLLDDLSVSINEAKIHRTNSFKELLSELNLKDDKSRNALFDVGVSFNTEAEFKEFEPDLLFAFNDNGKILKLKLHYNKVLIEHDTAERMLKHFESILGSSTAQSNTVISKLEYLSEIEKKQLLDDFNDTLVAFPDNSSLIDLFDEQVKKTPNKIALVFEQNAYTYSALNTLSNKLGAYLKLRYSIKADDLIGIKLERGEWMIISILAVLKSGGAYVPIDPDYPQERINYIISDSQCKVIIDDEELQKFNGVIDDFDDIDKISDIKPTDLAYIMYTSGSTGLPKGVMVTHRNVIRLVNPCNFVEINGDEILLATGAFSFDATTFEFWSMLLHGGQLILCNQKTLLDIKLLSLEIQKHKVSIMWFTSGWLNQLIDTDISIFKGLKYLLAGGDKLSPVHINKLRNTFPLLKIINGYGPTENTTFSLTYPINSELNNIPIGQPISNSSVYILNADKMLVPIGVPGEIYLGGSGVARGYLNKKELTAEKFIKNPFKDNEIIYRSGDIGKWLPDGNIIYLGRKDFQVKIRGYRIEIGEIENTLQKFSKVEKVVVTVRGGDNENEKKLIAYIQSEKNIETSELRGFLSDKLPSYMIPSFFINLPQFPLTSNGKIDREALPDPDEINNKPLGIMNPLANEDELHLVNIWTELLGLKNIKTTDNFFEIGGHSLIAIKFIIRLENELNVKLPMSALFEYPTIQKIAQLIRSENQQIKWKSLVAIKPSGSKSPIYLIHGAGLGVLIFNNIVMYLDKNQPAYGLQAVGIDGVDEPLETIEAMAEFYISEILQQNPEGPYMIAGLSSGGLIAFEMAQQLKKMGKKVKMLAVFDFDLNEMEIFNNRDLKSKLKRVGSNLFAKFIFSIKSVIKYPGKTINYQIMCWKLRWISLERRIGIEQKNDVQGIQKTLQYAMSKNEEAFKKYKLNPYDGALDLFIAKEKVYYQKDPIYMGWKPFINGGINLHEVNGDHDDMILPPNNINFAVTLQKIMNSRN